MKRSTRDFAANMEQQLKAFKPLRVNPFSLMMEAAAKHSSVERASAQAAAAADAPAPSSSNGVSSSHASSSCSSSTTALAVWPIAQQRGAGSSHDSIPCTHCGAALSDLAAQQCHTCKNVYCSNCSVANYDAREDRTFCLECHQEATRSDDLHEDMAGGFGSQGSDDSSGSAVMQACSWSAAAAVDGSSHCNSSRHRSSSHAAWLAGSQHWGDHACHGMPAFVGSSSSSRRSGVCFQAWDLNAGSAPGAGVPHGSAGLWGGPGASSGVVLPERSSPVIPFWGSGNDGYEALANRVLDCCQGVLPPGC